MSPSTAARQAPLSRGFSRQEYWSGLPCPSPGDLPDPRGEPRSPALQADSLLLNHQGSPKCSIKIQVPGSDLQGSRKSAPTHLCFSFTFSAPVMFLDTSPAQDFAPLFPLSGKIDSYGTLPPSSMCSHVSCLLRSPAHTQPLYLPYVVGVPNICPLEIVSLAYWLF